MEGKYYDERTELTRWINDIKIMLMDKNYVDRGRLQRKLMTLEKARRNLDSRHDEWNERLFYYYY